jgi:hypothetical protein
MQAASCVAACSSPAVKGLASCYTSCLPHLTPATTPARYSQMISRAGEGLGLQVFPGSVKEMAQVRLGRQLLDLFLAHHAVESKGLVCLSMLSCHLYLLPQLLCATWSASPGTVVHKDHPCHSMTRPGLTAPAGPDAIQDSLQLETVTVTCNVTCKMLKGSS